MANMLRTASIASPRSSVLRPAARSLSSTAFRRLAQPSAPSETETEQLNEAQRYLASKAARKAQRASNPHAASARHASLYSQLFPALLRILAYGSSAYFGLHLLWNVLDRDEQTKLMNSQTGALEATAKSIAAKVDKAVGQVGEAASSSKASWPNAQADKTTKKPWYWPF